MKAFTISGGAHLFWRRPVIIMASPITSGGSHYFSHRPLLLGVPITFGIVHYFWGYPSLLASSITSRGAQLLLGTPSTFLTPPITSGDAHYFSHRPLLLGVPSYFWGRPLPLGAPITSLGTHYFCWRTTSTSWGAQLLLGRPLLLVTPSTSWGAQYTSKGVHCFNGDPLLLLISFVLCFYTFWFWFLVQLIILHDINLFFSRSRFWRPLIFCDIVRRAPLAPLPSRHCVAASSLICQIKYLTILSDFS